MKKLKSKKNISLILNLIFLVLNIVLLFINIPYGIYNIIKTNNEIEKTKNEIEKNNIDNTKTKIEIIKEFPLFEIQYLEIDADAYFLYRTNSKSDSIYSDALKNYFFIYDKGGLFTTIEQTFDYPYKIVALAIKQIGGSIAKDVTIEYNYIKSQKGISYFVTTCKDVMDLDDVNKDIFNNSLTKTKKYIKYGDIIQGKGLIIPLFAIAKRPYISDLPDEFFINNIKNDFNNEEYSKTSNNILIPIKLKYRNKFDNSVKEIKIREMNNSIITISWFVEGRVKCPPLLGQVF